MITKRYALVCDVCETPATTRRGLGSETLWFDTSGGAAAHGRWLKWMRIPKGDPRDTSKQRRGMDVCQHCRSAFEAGAA